MEHIRRPSLGQMSETKRDSTDSSLSPGTPPSLASSHTPPHGTIALVVGTAVPERAEERIGRDELPRRDYLELRDRLGAVMIQLDRPGRLSTRLVWRALGRQAAHAWEAYLRRSEYDVVHTLSEDVGLTLEVLFRITGTRRRHIMVAHHLSPLKKRLLVRVFGLAARIDRLIVYSSPQKRVAVERLGFPSDRVELVLHPADHGFWRPAEGSEPALVASAGLEHRDYATLVAAVRDLRVEVFIAAASPWATRGSKLSGADLPPNVRTEALTPAKLRSLLQRAAFVVVPLVETDFQAGSLVMYEAMACGKALVVSRTRGQEDIVQPGVTGDYVPPGEVAALRRAISALLDDPQRAAEMGRLARGRVEGGLNLEIYVERVAAILRQAVETGPSRPAGSP